MPVVSEGSRRVELMREALCPASAISSCAVSLFVLIVCSCVFAVLMVGVVLSLYEGGRLATSQSVISFVCECIGLAMLGLCVIGAACSSISNGVELWRRGKLATERQDESAAADAKSSGASSGNAETEEDASETTALLQSP